MSRLMRSRMRQSWLPVRENTPCHIRLSGMRGGRLVVGLLSCLFCGGSEVVIELTIIKVSKAYKEMGGSMRDIYVVVVVVVVDMWKADVVVVVVDVVVEVVVVKVVGTVVISEVSVVVLVVVVVVVVVVSVVILVSVVDVIVVLVADVVV